MGHSHLARARTYFRAAGRRRPGRQPEVEVDAVIDFLQCGDAAAISALQKIYDSIAEIKASNARLESHAKLVPKSLKDDRDNIAQPQPKQ
jgi:hypothetical protein